MIDIENEVFTPIADALRAVYPDIFVTGEKINAPETFPCVSIEESDNYSFARSQSNDSLENHAEVMYEVQIITNKQIGKKSECKSIFAIVDTQFETLGFARTAKFPIPMDDAQTYQLVGRYRAVVSQNKTIFRR